MGIENELSLEVDEVLKGVIFDMDGVIYDSEPIHFLLEKEIFRNLGIEVSEEEHHSFVGTSSYYMWEALKNKYELKQLIDDLVKLERGGYLEILINKKKELSPIEGVVGLIEMLKNNNLKLAVASSSSLEVIERVVDLFGFGIYFDNLTSGDCVERSKPEPDIFLYSANKLGIDPADCLVIEDSYHGVKAAKKAGMKCIGYRNMNSGDQDLSKADFIIENYDSIDIELLKSLFM